MFTDYLSKKQLIKTLIFSSIGIACLLIWFMINELASLRLDKALGGYIAATILIFVGWVGGNRIEFSYRRSNKHLSGALPLEVLDKKLCFRSPLIVSSLLTLTLSIVLEFIYVLI